MKAAALPALMFVFATAAGARPGYTTPLPGGTSTPLVIVTGAPDKEYAGPGAAVVPNTSFIIMQTKGGSIFLGPLLGAANIEAKSRDLAKKSAGGYMGVDLQGIATLSLALIGAGTEPNANAFTVKPYGYVQQCGDDEMYRVSIAYDVKGPGGRDAWHGRYVAHLANPIPYARFLNPTDEQVAAFQADLTAAADAATRLLQRDMQGELPEIGREVKFGSLNFIGNKLGGMGIYTAAKDMWLPNAQLIEDKDGSVVVRTKAHPSTFIFGMHTMARGQVHKLEEEAKKKKQ
jgi:hypothetical protein